MVGAVIHYVQQDLPERLLPWIALHVAVGNLGLDVLIAQRRAPFLPALLNGRPLLAENAEMAIFGSEERGGRFTTNSC